MHSCGLSFCMYSLICNVHVSSAIVQSIVQSGGELYTGSEVSYYVVCGTNSQVTTLTC